MTGRYRSARVRNGFVGAESIGGLMYKNLKLGKKEEDRRGSRRDLYRGDHMMPRSHDLGVHVI